MPHKIVLIKCKPTSSKTWGIKNKKYKKTKHKIASFQRLRPFIWLVSPKDTVKFILKELNGECKVQMKKEMKVDHSVWRPKQPTTDVLSHILSIHQHRGVSVECSFHSLGGSASDRSTQQDPHWSSVLLLPGLEEVVTHTFPLKVSEAAPSADWKANVTDINMTSITVQLATATH